jgi:APA family basic amino acid/polyamine antiporter
MLERAASDDPVPLTILGVYALVGAVIYAAYGFWHSKLAKGIDITEDTTLQSADAAQSGVVDPVKHG